MALLLALFQTDTTQATNQAMAAVAGMMGIIIFIGLIFLAFMIFVFWRILTKAGMAGPLSLLIILWPIGLIVVACILAFGEWKVVPAIQAAYSPVYPPPPAYPPQAPPTV